MAGALAWETLLRSGLSHSLLQRGCQRGWSVVNHRGLTRLNIAARAGGGTRRQLLLPIPWAADQVDAIREAVLLLHDAVREREDPGEIITKLSGRDAQYRPRMALPLKLLDPSFVAAPQDSTALFQRVSEEWASQPGCRARQIQVQHTAAIL